MNEDYIKPEEACEILKVSPVTLINWNKTGKIECLRTKGGHRRYLRNDILGIPKDQYVTNRIRKKICYCRVSTRGQKEDLDRQVEFFKRTYSDYTIIKDIGSGLNFKRKGFNSILESAIKGDIGEIVVTHKDRLCRFGYPIIEKIIESYHGKILVLNQENNTPEQEVINDLISIITCFSSRVYGLRSGQIKKAIKEAIKIENNEVSPISHRGNEGENYKVHGSMEMVL